MECQISVQAYYFVTTLLLIYTWHEIYTLIYVTAEPGLLYKFDPVQSWLG